MPWLKQQQESGTIGFSHKTATKYMNLAANMNRGSYLTEAPSIRAALELLSDKEPDPQQQGTLIDVEAERQARESLQIGSAMPIYSNPPASVPPNTLRIAA